MRKLMFFSLSLYFLASNVFLYAEEAIENAPEQPQSSIPSGSQLILFDLGRVWGLMMDRYIFADGSKLSYKNLKENLSLVPENEKYIRRAETWNVLQWVSMGATIGLATGQYLSLLNENPSDYGGISTRTYALLYSCLASVTLEAFSIQLIRTNMDKAVDNYNLTVMGFPVRYR